MAKVPSRLLVKGEGWYPWKERGRKAEGLDCWGVKGKPRRGLDWGVENPVEEGRNEEIKQVQIQTFYTVT